jgi:hypothetical protein
VARFGQALIDPRVIGAKRASALQQQNFVIELAFRHCASFGALSVVARLVEKAGGANM